MLDVLHVTLSRYVVFSGIVLTFGRYACTRMDRLRRGDLHHQPVGREKLELR